MFYEIFVRLCKEKGISPTKAGTAIGCSRSTVNGWKNGAQPHPKKMAEIAKYFGVSVAYLTGEEQPQNNAQNVINSAVVQGNHATTLIVKNGSTYEKELTDQEVELLRIFEVLDVKKKISLLSYAFDLEEQQEKGK